MVTKCSYCCLFLVLLLTGCMGRSPIYKNVIRPHTTDFDRTPIGSKRCFLSEYKFKEPVSGYGVSAEWDSTNIITAARQAGITRIYYIEKQTFSIGFGVYKRTTLIVNGD